MSAVCGIGRPSGRRNRAVTANQSATPPTIDASAPAWTYPSRVPCTPAAVTPMNRAVTATRSAVARLRAAVSWRARSTTDSDAGLITAGSTLVSLGAPPTRSSPRDAEGVERVVDPHRCERGRPRDMGRDGHQVIAAGEPAVADLARVAPRVGRHERGTPPERHRDLGRGGQGQPDRPAGRVVAGCGGWIRLAERALHLADDQARDAGQALDEDDPRVDVADLFPQLRLAVRGDLTAEHDQVERPRIEPFRDVAEVVRALCRVAEAAETGDGFVEDELAPADQQDAALGGCGSGLGLGLGLGCHRELLCWCYQCW